MDNKWKMFKNYMHNELGITKEDIQEWVREAVEKVAKDYVENHISYRELDRYIEEIIRGKWTNLHDNIYRYVAQEIMKNITISLKKDETDGN